MPADEEWRPVVGFPGYEVSDHGRVGSRMSKVRNDSGYRPELPRTVLAPHPSPYGHLSVTLWTGGGGHKHKQVHGLVLDAFHGPCPPGRQCRHLDGNPANNHVSNLTWGTPAENTRDAIGHGTHVSLRRHGGPRLRSENVRDIRRLAEAGVKHDYIATACGVSLRHLSRIVNGHSREGTR